MKNKIIVLYMYMYMYTYIFLLAGNEPSVFPAHQPILDPPELKQHYNAFMTSSMEAYGSPSKQKQMEVVEHKIDKQ